MCGTQRYAPPLPTQAKMLILPRNQSLEFPEWEVELEFYIGSDQRRGADGMAMWYTRDRMEEGPVFGSKDQWTGLGIFFDTFDNDNKVRISQCRI